VTASDEPSIGADVQLISFGLRPCWALLEGRFDLAPCLSFTVEHVRAEGSGDHIASRTADATWIAAGIGAQARLRATSWFAVVGRVSAEAETSRPLIAIDGVGTLGQIWPVSIRLLLGPEWIF
jgi:hypothetical protein